MATTSKPTGLTLSRNGNNFTLSWKKGDNNYDAGQNFEWRTNNDAKFIANSIAKRDTSKVKQLSESNYYPNTELLLEWIEMRVRGKRAKYKKKGKTIKPTMSAWATKRLDLAPPKKPQLTATMHESQWNVCTFAWEVETSDTDIYWFNDVEWETILVKESDVTNGADLAWETDETYQSGTGTKTDNQVITEDSFDISDGSYTRWFRVRSRGPAGASGWEYQNHVYGLSYQAIIESAVATVQPAGGFQCRVVWEAPANPSHPIDKTTVEYSITVPDADLACPDDASWTSANVSADTENKDAAVFPIDRLLANDQCLFVRVNTEHDGVNTYGVPRLVDGGVGALSNPTLNSVTIGDNYMVTINATNASSVADSYLVILYRPASDPTREIVLGTIPHGQTSKSVQAPDWSGETAYAFGVYAAVGDSTTISHDGALMKSAIVWGTGNVPKAPENVKVSATNISGTIRVEWDWTWTEADGAELSWADHEDAWESTDEPETYELSNIRNSRWNISGLETGVKWYVKVRLKKGTGENETYGPYSEIQVIDLTSAPSIPTLVLSEPVITETGSVTASWVYTTTDGTAQTYAEICEAELTTEGIEYGDIIAHTETAQHVTINAEDAGWQTGETYYLCVRVVSASGRVSDDWSAPVPIAIAEPLEVNITETSLVEETDETNPRTFSGNPISFDTEIEEQFAELKVELEATQSGSGTPSPSNVRPIYGVGGVTVYDSPTENEEDAETYTQEFNVSLTPTSKDTDPYLFKAVGDIYGDRLEEELVGGSVVWNQLIAHSEFSQGITGWGTYNATIASESNAMKITSTGAWGNARTNADNPNYVAGHKYLILIVAKGDNGGEYIGVNNNNGVNIKLGDLTTSKAMYSWIFTATNTGNYSFSIMTNTSGNIFYVYEVTLIDLTQFFGNSTIADAIYAMEQSQAGSSVAFMRKYFHKLFTADYDAGTLKSVNPTAHVTVGKNQGNTVKYKGQYEGQGVWNGDLLTRITTEYIGVIPNTDYFIQLNPNNPENLALINYNYFDADKNWLGNRASNGDSAFAGATEKAFNISNTNARYVRITFQPKANDTDNIQSADLAKAEFQFAFGTARTAYEPYEEHTYDLGNVPLYGLFQLENGKLKAYGDVRKYDGSLTRKYVVISGTSFTLHNTSSAGYKTYKYNTNTGGGLNKGNLTPLTNIGLKGVSSLNSATVSEECIQNTDTSNGIIYLAIAPSRNIADVVVQYELLNATTETTTPFEQYQEVSKYGTLEYITTNNVPVGHNTTYMTRDVFGGYIDLVSGRLVVTHKSIDLGTVTFGKSGSVTGGFTGTLTDRYPNVNNNQMLCSTYDFDGFGNSNRGYYGADNTIRYYYSGAPITNCEIYIRDTSKASLNATQFKEALNGEQLLIPLETPLTYQLTPKQIQTLLGTNNVWGNGSLNVRIAEDARSIYALKEMPLTLTVDKGNITAVIERATSYHIDRPNETAFDGFEGETIAIKKGNVESFDIEDLIGSLDDGALYRLIVTVKDELGQSAEDSIDFEVHWTHQALMPEGQVVIDSEEYIAKITPQAPQGALITDVCDIYRLSSDRPELIVKGGTFAETYVDPYPAIGQFGGYRLVFRTANGDYITTDNEIAWLDIDERLDIGYTIIDFDGGQVFLQYNVDVSNAWAKDFQETKYLGGSVQGDWNPAVSRTSSINAVTITIVDEEQIEMIHRLAVTPSLCHVRTTGGASFSADVQVAENYTHEKRGKIASYTFTITRVDTEHLDGMTLAQWEDLQEEDELE